MRRTLYLIQKEFRQIFRERININIIFIMPFIQLVLLGFAITTDVTNISTIVVDQDRSVLSRRMIDAVSDTKTFRYKGQAASVAQAVRLIDVGLAKLAVVIPARFERDLKNGRKPTVQVLLDGVDGNSAGITSGYVTKVMMKLQKEWAALGGASTAELRRLRLVEIEPRMLYNPKLDSQNNIVPGILAILLTMITMFLTTINIVREKELGTLEQLSVTPIRNYELIIAKILPLAILGFALFNVGLLAAGLIFGIWLKGNLFLLYLFSIVYMFTTLGVGILISTAAATQQQAMFIAWFFSIFVMLLSGFFVPIENMPPVIQWITYLNPTRYFMAVVRGIVLKGSGLSVLWPELISLIVFGGVILNLAVLQFHKRIR
jgi:ABC-2 type transport system permease protein